MTTDPSEAEVIITTEVNVSANEVVYQVDLSKSVTSPDLIENLCMTMSKTTLEMYNSGHLMKNLSLEILEGFFRARFVFGVDRYKHLMDPTEQSGYKHVFIDDIIGNLDLGKDKFSFKQLGDELKNLFLRGPFIVWEGDKVVAANTPLPGIARIRIGIHLCHSDVSFPKLLADEVPAEEAVPADEEPVEEAVPADEEPVEEAVQVPVHANASELLIYGVMLYSHKRCMYSEMLNDPALVSLKNSATKKRVVSGSTLRSRWSILKRDASKEDAVAAVVGVTQTHLVLLRALIRVGQAYETGISEGIYNKRIKNESFGHWVTALHLDPEFTRVYDEETRSGSEIGLQMLRVGRHLQMPRLEVAHPENA